MEIKVGEYARTSKGLIGKILYIYDEAKTLEDIGIEPKVCNIDKLGDIEIKQVVKHSKIISEIVEVGDYVNGKLIHKIDKGPNYCYLYYGNCKTFVNYQIKSIVTHEQFSQMEYKVETEE